MADYMASQLAAAGLGADRKDWHHAFNPAIELPRWDPGRRRAVVQFRMPMARLRKEYK